MSQYEFYPLTGPAIHGSEHGPSGSDPLPVAAFYPAAVSLADATSIATNAALGSYFRVTLGGNRELANPTGAVDTQRITWEIIQDGTGGRVLTYGNKFTFGTDVTEPVLSVTAGLRDFLYAIYNASTDKFYVVGFARGL